MAPSKSAGPSGPGPGLSNLLIAKLPKGTIVAQPDQIARNLAEAVQQGKEKDMLELLETLTLLSEKPVAVVPELIKITMMPSDKGKARRYAYYLLTDIVSSGSSGAPRPFTTSEEGTRLSSLPPADLASVANVVIDKLAPRAVAREGVPPEDQALILQLFTALYRTLFGAAKRDRSLLSHLGRAEEALTIALEHAAVVFRAYVSSKSGGLPSPVKKAVKSDAAARQTALLYIRAALETVRGLPWTLPLHVAWRGSVERILDQDLPRALSLGDPIITRDALALVVQRVALGQAAGLGMATRAVLDTLASFPVLHEADGVPRKERQLVLNLLEPEARALLCQLCALGISRAEATTEAREAFFRCLSLLAAHDPSTWVSMEACRGLFGDAQGSGDGSAEGPVTPTAQRIEAWARAWHLFLEKVGVAPYSVPPPSPPGGKPKKPKKGEAEGGQAKELVLLEVIGSRLQAAVMGGRAPLLLSACHVARACGRARAAYVFTGGGQTYPSAVTFLQRVDQLAAAAAAKAVTLGERVEAFVANLFTADPFVESSTAAQLVGLLKACPDSKGLGALSAGRLLGGLTEVALLRPGLAPSLVNLFHLFCLARAATISRPSVGKWVTAFWEALIDSPAPLAHRAAAFSAVACVRLGCRAASPNALALIPNLSVLLEEGLLIHPAAVARAAGPDAGLRALLLILAGKESSQEGGQADPMALLDQDATVAMAQTCQLSQLVSSWQSLRSPAGRPDPEAEQSGLRWLATQAADFLGANANFVASEYIWQWEDLMAGAERMRENGQVNEAAATARDLNRTLGPLRIELNKETTVTVPVLNRAAALSGAVATLMTAAVQLAGTAASIGACRALGTIAVRSGEPIRGYLGGFLRQLAGRGGTGTDLHLLGLAAEAELFLHVLDLLQAGKVTFRKVMAEAGRDANEWGEDLLESTFVRHCQLQAAVKSLGVVMPVTEFHPLGAASKPFVSHFSSVTGADPRKYVRGGGYAAGAGVSRADRPFERVAGLDAFDRERSGSSGSSSIGLPVLISKEVPQGDDDDDSYYDDGYLDEGRQQDVFARQGEASFTRGQPAAGSQQQASGLDPVLYDVDNYGLPAIPVVPNPAPPRVAGPFPVAQHSGGGGLFGSRETDTPTSSLASPTPAFGNTFGSTSAFTDRTDPLMLSQTMATAPGQDLGWGDMASSGSATGPPPVAARIASSTTTFEHPTVTTSPTGDDRYGPGTDQDEASPSEPPATLGFHRGSFERDGDDRPEQASHGFEPDPRGMETAAVSAAPEPEAPMAPEPESEAAAEPEAEPEPEEPKEDPLIAKLWAEAMEAEARRAREDARKAMLARTQQKAEAAAVPAAASAGEPAAGATAAAPQASPIPAVASVVVASPVPAPASSGPTLVTPAADDSDDDGFDFDEFLGPEVESPVKTPAPAAAAASPAPAFSPAPASSTSFVQDDPFASPAPAQQSAPPAAIPQATPAPAPLSNMVVPSASPAAPSVTSPTSSVFRSPTSVPGVGSFAPPLYAQQPPQLTPASATRHAEEGAVEEEEEDEAPKSRSKSIPGGGGAASPGGFVVEELPVLSMAYAFTAEAEGEISVAEGVKVVVVSEDIDGWRTVRVVNTGQEGLVPSSYVAGL